MANIPLLLPKNKNMKKIFTIALLAIMSGTLFSRDFTDRNIIKNRYTFEQVKDALVMDQKWVLYPAYSDRAGWDRMTGEYKDGIIKNGEKYLDYEWKVIKATDFLAYDQNGNRVIMETPYFANNNAIAALFCAELAEGKGRFLPQLINGIFHHCEMTTWSLSAHLSGSSLPRKGDNTLELFQGSMSQLISWVVYFLHDAMDAIQPEFTKRFTAEVKYRELDSYLTRNDFWWMGLGENLNKGFLNNWTTHCVWAALYSFMLLENDRDRLAQAVWKSIQSLDQYINYIQGDGGIEEGPGYWYGAPGALYQCLKAISDITGGKINVFDNKQIRDMGEYIVRSYVGDGWVVNFADAGPRGRGSGKLVYRYGKAVGSDLMMGYANHLRDNGASMAPSLTTDISSFLEDLYSSEEYRNSTCKYEPSKYTWYPETEFHYMSNDKGVFVAARGGYNEESHNHNDIGSFNLYYDNLPVLIDVGVETYSRKTFSDERYTIWTMQSSYHNVPQINGVAQKDGKKYRASECVSTPNSFSVNIAGAYPADAKVQKWVRSYKMDGKVVRMTDKFSLSEAVAPNALHFMTWGDVDTSVPGVITVNVQGHSMEMKYDKSLFTADSEVITLTDEKLRHEWGDDVIRITLKANKVQKSGTYTITITKK